MDLNPLRGKSSPSIVAQLAKTSEERIWEKLFDDVIVLDNETSLVNLIKEKRIPFDALRVDTRVLGKEGYNVYRIVIKSGQKECENKVAYDCPNCGKLIVAPPIITGFPQLSYDSRNPALIFSCVKCGNGLGSKELYYKPKIHY